MSDLRNRILKVATGLPVGNPIRKQLLRVVQADLQIANADDISEEDLWKKISREGIFRGVISRDGT